MANSSTVNSLETLVRARLNLTNVATVSSTDMKLFIRSSMKELRNKVANKHRDYYVVPWQLSLVSGQSKYSIPADFQTAVIVWLIYGSGTAAQRQVLEQFTIDRYQALPAQALIAPQWPTMYRIMGSEIWFTPTPSQDYTGAVEMLYVPQWTGPVNDDVTIDTQLPNGWERWIEYDVCVQVCTRLRMPEPFAMYKGLRDEAEQTVMSGVSIRDEQPQYMTDAYSVPWIGFDTPGAQ